VRGDSSPGGSATSPRVFTAFGEPISGASARYGYVGSWGYQAHEEFPFFHVGARYYDPAIGRFLQRDPIGINGGFNAYSYVNGMATLFLDPLGLYSWFNSAKGAAATALVWLVRSVTATAFGPVGFTIAVCGTGAIAGLEKRDFEKEGFLYEALETHMRLRGFAPPPPQPNRERPYYCHSCPLNGTPHAHIGRQPGRY
jgi:RHS repeat-associated protein